MRTTPLHIHNARPGSPAIAILAGDPSDDSRERVERIPSGESVVFEMPEEGMAMFYPLKQGEEVGDAIKRVGLAMAKKIDVNGELPPDPAFADVVALVMTPETDPGAGDDQVQPGGDDNPDPAGVDFDLRLQLIARVASLVRQNIDRNEGRYDGTTAPNLQSIIELASLLPDDPLLAKLPAQLDALERGDSVDGVAHGAAENLNPQQFDPSD